MKQREHAGWAAGVVWRVALDEVPAWVEWEVRLGPADPIVRLDLCRADGAGTVVHFSPARLAGDLTPTIYVRNVVRGALASLADYVSEGAS